MAVRDIGHALGVRDFRWLWIGSLCSSFSMNMQQVARGWLVYDLTSSKMALAWVMMSFMLPQIVFSLWGGVVADRWPKRTILVVAQSLNCAATIVMAIIILTDRIEFWDFIWFGAFNGTVLALSIPGRHAFVPELIKPNLIITAMALSTSAMNFARIAAPAIAGVLIAVLAAGDTTSTFGVGIVYLVISTLYLISASSTALVSKPGNPRAASDRGTHFEEIRDAFRYVLGHGPVLALILLSIVPFMFGMTLNTLLPAFSEDVLEGGADNLGFLLSAMGIGAITGSLTLAAVGNLSRKGAWVIGTCIAWAIGTIAFGASSSFLVTAVLAAIVGGLSSWNMSLNRGVMQMAVEPHLRGRVMSIDMMSHGLMPLGIIPMSYLAELHGVAFAIMTSGAIFLAATLLLYATSRAVRQIDGELEGRLPAHEESPLKPSIKNG